MRSEARRKAAVALKKDRLSQSNQSCQQERSRTGLGGGGGDGWWGGRDSEGDERRGERGDGPGGHRGAVLTEGINRRVGMWRHVRSSKKEQRCLVTHLRSATLPPTRSGWENGKTDGAQPGSYPGNREGSLGNVSPVPVVAPRIYGHLWTLEGGSTFLKLFLNQLHFLARNRDPV